MSIVPGFHRHMQTAAVSSFQSKFPLNSGIVLPFNHLSVQICHSSYNKHSVEQKTIEDRWQDIPSPQHAHLNIRAHAMIAQIQ